MKRIAIIGAGLSGLTLAQKLSKKTEVTVFEKAQGMGGRMSTRYADPFSFDHGAQSFTIRTPVFQSFLEPYFQAGVLAQWKGERILLEKGKKAVLYPTVEPDFVAIPHMNSLCKALASDINIRINSEVAPLGTKIGALWELYDKEHNTLGFFDWVISTAPSPQTLHLFNRHIPSYEPITQVAMESRYTLMIGLNSPWERTWVAAQVLNSPIASISVNSTKPGRNPKQTTLVIHSTSQWARLHLNSDRDWIQHALLAEGEFLTEIDTKKADFLSIHRWRYSMVDKTHNLGPYIDLKRGLAAAGDWCQASQIESVWFHANSLADAILAKLSCSL